MPVNFYATMNDHTGYGNAVKNFSNSFLNSGIRTRLEFKGMGRIKKTYNFGLSRTLDSDFYLQIPEYNFYAGLNRNYRIGYFYWEADKLPESWGKSIKTLDEIWAPCNLVKEVCIDSGYNGEIKVVPTPCEDWESDKKLFIPAPGMNYNIDDSIYKFYSIFQWHSRKGYRTLLNSYYKAFNRGDRVILILKVNPIRPQESYIQKIKDEILEIKRKLNQQYYPPVYLIHGIVGLEEIRAIHNSADCFVLPHHGEGWGMPIHDAMLQGKQIITTKYGGITEWLSSSSAHIIEHKMGPVQDMSWNKYYNKKQNWAYPMEDHLVSIFRDVYLNHESYSNKGSEAKKIAKDFTINSISKVIYKNLLRFK
jgi:hypothetical protein